MTPVPSHSSITGFRRAARRPEMCNIIRYTLVGAVRGLLGLAAVHGMELPAQAPAADKLWPNLESNIERPLRYRPDNGDFVIENGAEFFNRPLYGGNTAFRVDAGDRPEFSLYLPGRGGNLRLGLRTATDVKWLHEAATIEARYRPGGMIYTVRDPLLGPDGVLRLTAYALSQTEGLILRIEYSGGPSSREAAPLELSWAYGGVNGQRGKRDGDIGTESVPISEWFKLRPDFCADNRFEIGADGFTLRAALPRGQKATIRGLVPGGAVQAVADATRWNDSAALFGETDSVSRPVITGHVALANSSPVFLALQRIDETASATDLDTYREVTAGAAAPLPMAKLLPAYKPGELPAVFARTKEYFATVRRQIEVETPDPYINAAVGALNVAADAVWDEPQQAIMHGAIAWRTKLLGWRGPYALDALGWADRARKHFEYWAARQNTTPIPDKLPPPDANANLARSETALHSNGDLSNSHYDMNLVYIDALFRHLLWTGDIEFAKRMWPVIERHLAWERRLFRREFEVNGQKLPLYEAYAAIWASDDLQYHGGGSAHGSAYNYFHNREAARLARLLGYDPAPYEDEAGKIAWGMRELLWTGTHFAEFKDLLGRQLVHPSAGLWTFYHAMDAGIPNPHETTRMAANLPPSIPVRGPGVPADRPYAVHASTDWLPYTWSLNNVVMGENIHTALGLWQGGLAEEAFTLTKGALLASMFMGICPGNVGSMNTLDVYRRESQRDFADGSGVTSRALVEGLFGVRPDALVGEVTIAPGWPTEWRYARLRHPGVSVDFKGDGKSETYRVMSSGTFRRLRFRLPMRFAHATVFLGGEEIGTTDAGPDNVELEVFTTFTGAAEIRVEWSGGAQARSEKNSLFPGCGVVENSRASDPAAMEPVDLAAHFNDRVTEIFKPGKYVSPRSPFVSLALPAQGIGYWAGHVNATADVDDTGLRATAGANGGKLTLPNGVSFATPGTREAKNILFASQWDNYPREATVPLAGKARRVHLLMAGSTNAMQSRLDNGEVVVTYTDGATSRLALRNPETWWPIDQDYFIDDYQFRVDGPLPTRVNLKTGEVRVLDRTTFKGQGKTVPGGAATVLDLPLDPTKELRSLTVRALANEVVIGLMAATLER
jgi:hypothetical protein